MHWLLAFVLLAIATVDSFEGSPDDEDLCEYARYTAEFCPHSSVCKSLFFSPVNSRLFDFTGLRLR